MQVNKNFQKIIPSSSAVNINHRVQDAFRGKRLCIFLIKIVLILFLSLSLTNYIAPMYLNADVLLNSIMSIQNVTLFYWGQNRLLNIVPFLLSFITDPKTNLIAYMLFASSIFFSLLWSLSILLSKSIYQNVEKYELEKQKLVVFLLLTTFTLLFFKKGLLFEFTIWHIEYTLSYLLLFIIYINFITYKTTFKKYIIYFILLFLATGINNSILIPAVSIFFAHILLSKKNRVFGFSMLISSIFIFLLYSFISKHYNGPGSSIYTSINIENINGNLTKVISNIISTLQIEYILIGLFIISVFAFFIETTKYENLHKINIALFSFSIVWLLLFSNHSWIQMNAYHHRYFFPIFIIGIYLFTFYTLTTFKFLYQHKIKYFILLFLVCFPVLLLKSPIIGIADYKVFKEWRQANAHISEQYIFHAGDYWRVWPAVLYDLINNSKSFGLTFRSDGNRVNTYKALTSNNPIDIYCHNSDTNSCQNELQTNLGSNHTVELLDTNEIDSNLLKLTYKINKVTIMDYALKNPKVKIALIKLHDKNTDTVTLKVANLSGEKWLAGHNGKYGLALSYMLENKTNRIKTGYDNRFYLPHNIKPGESFEITIPIKKLYNGENILTFSMVQELVTWFHDKGNIPLVVKIEKKGIEKNE